MCHRSNVTIKNQGIGGAAQQKKGMKEKFQN
jgi:hypothetical protein